MKKKKIFLLFLGIIGFILFTIGYFSNSMIYLRYSSILFAVIAGASFLVRRN